MNNNYRVLSTKKLTDTQSELLLSTGLALVHYDILKIEPVDVDLNEQDLTHVIITSSNAIDVLRPYKDQVKKLYVVGEKTGDKLIGLGYNVILVAQDGTQLAQKLISDYYQHHFTYICGIHRRDELPQALISTQINFAEVKVYDSVVVEKSFDCIFDAVLFFSPRGVHAFAKVNPSNLQCAICIGETTATAARTYTQKVIVANKTTIENTIVTAVKALLND